eukprot:TRINITY_DN3453_c0_g1_i1.p1 TRINITY_DN3453_c0_g1~~TRINITY_DN3453_c0_g1_i1.p1  ORF type:complete len:757 (+),score=198.13 TRINITY_DN3453_c0_g1_i1:44-2314(+)
MINVNMTSIFEALHLNDCEEDNSVFLRLFKDVGCEAVKIWFTMDLLEEVYKKFPNNFEVFILSSCTQIEECLTSENSIPYDIFITYNIIISQVISYTMLEGKEELFSSVFWKKYKDLDIYTYEYVVNQIMLLAFLPNITYRTRISSPTPIFDEMIWEEGIIIYRRPKVDRRELVCRRWILRTIATMLGIDIYRSPQNCFGKNNVFLECFLNRNLLNLAGFFTSIVNSGLGYEMRTSKIPYLSSLNQSYPIEVSCHCIQIFCLICLQSKTKEENVWLDLVSKISAKKDLEFLLEGFISMIFNPIKAARTFLPDSKKSITYIFEILTIFEIFVKNNEHFKTFILESSSKNQLFDLLIGTIIHMIEYSEKYDNAQIILVGGRILLELSEIREFCLRLNENISSKQKKYMVIKSKTFSNFLILALFKIINNLFKTNSAVLPLLFMTVHNISFFIENISSQASLQLLEFVKFIATPRFLFSEDKNARLLKIVLNTLSTIIEYSYSKNPYLIYVLLSEREDLLKILSFPVDRNDLAVKLNRNVEELTAYSDEFIADLNSLNESSKTILCLIKGVYPLISKQFSNQYVSSKKLFKFLQDLNLVGVIPSPRPYIINSIHDTEQTIGYLYDSVLYNLLCYYTDPRLFNSRFVKRYKFLKTKNTKPSVNDDENFDLSTKGNMKKEKFLNSKELIDEKNDAEIEPEAFDSVGYQSDIPNEADLQEISKELRTLSAAHLNINISDDEENPEENNRGTEKEIEEQTQQE